MSGDEADPAASEAQTEALSSFLRGFTYMRLLEKGDFTSFKSEQEKQRAVRGTMALDYLQHKHAQKRFDQLRAAKQQEMAVD